MVSLGRKDVTLGKAYPKDGVEREGQGKQWERETGGPQFLPFEPWLRDGSWLRALMKGK